MNKKLLVASVVSTVAFNGGLNASTHFQLSILNNPHQLELLLEGKDPEIVGKTNKKIVIKFEDYGERTVTVEKNRVSTHYQRDLQEEGSDDETHWFSQSKTISESVETLPFSIDLESVTMDIQSNGVALVFDRAATITEKVSGALHHGYDKVRTVASEVRERVSSTGKVVKGHAYDAAETVRETAVDAGVTAQRKAEHVGAFMKDKTVQAKDVVKRTAYDVKDKALQAKDTALEKAVDVKDAAEHTAHEAKNALSSTVHKTAAVAQRTAGAAKGTARSITGKAMEKVGSGLESAGESMESAGKKLQAKGAELEDPDDK